MAGFTEEYLGSVKPRLDAAVSMAVEAMGYRLITALEASAQVRVYDAHTPPPYFMAKRRGELLNDANYIVMKQGDRSVMVANVTVTQSGSGGEVNWVESGFRQHSAGARPFMEEGLQDYVATMADADLQAAMAAQGF
jgi:hypothetical protein